MKKFYILLILFLPFYSYAKNTAFELPESDIIILSDNYLLSSYSAFTKEIIELLRTDNYENLIDDNSLESYFTAIIFMTCQSKMQKYDLLKYVKRDNINLCLYFKALTIQESRLTPDAISLKGAKGLSQIMPSTAKSHCGIINPDDLYDPYINIECGIDYFFYNITLTCLTENNDYELNHSCILNALVAYNAGPSRVRFDSNNLIIPPDIDETINYILRIPQYYDKLRRSELRVIEIYLESKKLYTIKQIKNNKL